MAKQASAGGPGTISGSKLCELTGLTDRRHRQLAEEGFFPAPVRGEYQLKATLIGMFRYFKEQLHKKGDSVAAERKNYMVVRREKLEIERDILKGLYVKREEIAPLLRNVSLNLRANLQNKLENELPPKLAGQEPIEIRARMAAAVDELCRVFGNATSKWAEAEAGEGAAVEVLGGRRPKKRKEGE